MRTFKLVVLAVTFVALVILTSVVTTLVVLDVRTLLTPRMSSAPQEPTQEPPPHDAADSRLCETVDQLDDQVRELERRIAPLELAGPPPRP
jgi:hypothetical protein